MKQTLEGRYPAKSDVVIKMMTDKNFYTGRLDLEGIKGYEVLEHKFDGKRFSITLRRKLTGIAVTSVETWDVATKKGTINVDVQAMPIKISCQTALKDDGKDTLLVYNWDVSSGVPLVGGKLEKQFAAENEKQLSSQTAFGVQLLKNYL